MSTREKSREVVSSGIQGILPGRLFFNNSSSCEQEDSKYNNGNAVERLQPFNNLLFHQIFIYNALNCGNFHVAF